VVLGSPQSFLQASPVLLHMQSRRIRGVVGKKIPATQENWDAGIS